MSNQLLLVAINNGGIAELSDHSKWRVAPGDRATTANWQIGHSIDLSDAPSGSVWSTRLFNQDTGQAVGANRSFGPS